MAHSVPVRSGMGDYQVHIGIDILDQVGDRVGDQLQLAHARKAFIVRDANVPSPLLQPMVQSLSAKGLACSVHDLLPSEDAKTLATVELLGERAAAFGLSRSDLVVALGGGITGDVAGYFAASYQRGVAFVQCPTTLLAMVDASVGGKTGVNLNVRGTLLKNYMGAFHAPKLVLADVRTLASLPQRELTGALSECVKHAVIAPGLGNVQLVRHLPMMSSWFHALQQRNQLSCASLIAWNVMLKSHVVSGDERETSEDVSSGRALLNFGHTFGHAMETLPHAQAETQQAPGLSHGEAVALGMVAAAHTSRALKLIPDASVRCLEGYLRGLGLPTRAQGLPTATELVERMAGDKKARAGSLRVILLEKSGDTPGFEPLLEGIVAKVVVAPDTDALAHGWRAIGAL